ncbi:hypothetical protein SISNIDRAFT_443134 [Sistotremastrum niveocremeum HHB9708]|uniref:Protein CPL1-like domain-containing protein n=1 Tax=Sistotremastrum niveocremeum HHB9708 TaxID=1314777 RepID=A0A164SDH5_9AGAM|nr:hypothetical protein SISNIDRAFT_443134 [Sistotremastrum niveocremeum HHB9708]
MFRNIFLALAIALPVFSQGIVTPDAACQGNAFLEPVEEVVGVKKNGKPITELVCVCENINGVIKPFKKGCTAEIIFTSLVPTCQGVCTAPASPSKKAKRSDVRSQVKLLPDGSPSPCTANTVACPIPNATSLTGSASEFECVSPEEDIDNCGGCASTGEGVSCAEVPGVRGTTCSRGRCEIFSCARGYVLRTDIDGSKYCRKTFNQS